MSPPLHRWAMGAVKYKDRHDRKVEKTDKTIKNCSEGAVTSGRLALVDPNAKSSEILILFDQDRNIPCVDAACIA
jgi:hypothetical protein